MLAHAENRWYTVVASRELTLNCTHSFINNFRCKFNLRQRCVLAEGWTLSLGGSILWVNTDEKYLFNSLALLVSSVIRLSLTFCKGASCWLPVTFLLTYLKNAFCDPLWIYLLSTCMSSVYVIVYCILFSFAERNRPTVNIWLDTK